MLCLGGLGFLCECPLRCPAQLGGSLVTICLPRLRPAGVRSALLLQTLPCCCGLHPAATGYALRRSLSVVAGCLSNSRLCHQWECTSVEADCLSNGGRPSPTELPHHGFSCARSETLHLEHLESPFCLSHCATLNAISLESPGLAHCPSPIQSDRYANLPSQVSDCRFNRAPGPVCFVRSAVEPRCATAPAASFTGCQLHQPKPLPGVPRLFYTWEFSRSVGNKDPSGNAALTHPPRVH